MRHHLIPVRRLLQIANVSEGLEKREPLYNCWWECKPVQSLWKTVCEKLLSLWPIYLLPQREMVFELKYPCQVDTMACNLLFFNS